MASMNAALAGPNKVLLVDHDPRDAVLTLAALEEQSPGASVVVVDNGAEALDYLYRRGKYRTRANEKPVAVLLDNKIPKLSSLAILKILKADAHLKTIPVVVLSASSQPPELSEFYEHGINAYMVKPLDFRELMKVVNQVKVFSTVANDPPSAAW